MPYQFGTPWSGNFKAAGMQRGLGGMNMPDYAMRKPQVMQSPLMQMGAQLGNGLTPPAMQSKLMQPKIMPTRPDESGMIDAMRMQQPNVMQAPIGTGGFTPVPSPQMMPPEMMQKQEPIPQSPEPIPDIYELIRRKQMAAQATPAAVPPVNPMVKGY